MFRAIAGLTHVLCCFFLVVALAGCDDAPSELGSDLQVGEFEGSVTGSIERVLVGTANSQAGLTSSAADRTVWVLDLDDDENQLFVWLGVSGLPDGGEYPISFGPGPSDDDVLEEGHAYASLRLIEGDSTVLFAVPSGTLTIDRSSAQDVQGSVRVDGSRPDSDLSVSVEVAFRADIEGHIDNSRVSGSSADDD